MALYHKWGLKTGFIFALQFFMLISDSLGGMSSHRDLDYRTRAIITRGLYIFYPLFESQKRFFKEFFSENSVLTYGTIHLRRLHFLGGEGCPPLPTFADSRGVGVSGMPTSAIFFLNCFLSFKKYSISNLQSANCNFNFLLIIAVHLILIFSVNHCIEYLF